MDTNTTSPARASTLQAIPQELRALRQWVVWRSEVRDGKPTKVPYDAKTGQRAGTNQPATWCTFDQARARTGFDGIGFVLTGTPYVGVDFDGVIAENGEIEPYVLEIVRLLSNPYTEITPSGRGLRTFVIAPLPVGQRKFGRSKPEKYGAEIYSGSEGGRYLTTTGQKISGDGIPKLPDISLAYFLVSQILDDKFKKLWLGDTSEHGGDDSRADLALMGMLARALHSNRENMEAAFSASRLGQRTKWSKRADYRKRTIDKALEGSATPAASAAVSLPSTPMSLADSGNAQLVLESIGPHALYCKPRKEWFLADQTKRWSLDRTNRIWTRVQDVLLRRWQELSAHPIPKDPRLQHSLRSLDYPAIRHCVEILEFQQQLAVLPEQLDAEPLYLGVENGILNLVLGELVEPRLDLLVTKCAPVRFDPTAKCDAFLEYLSKVQPEEENRKFLQRLAGSFLAGLQPEQSFIFFHGEGGNGKSVFVRVCTDVLGSDYSFKARKQLLFLSGRRAPEHGANDVADLEGKRLITSTEQVGKLWNLEFIKDFTGGELQHGRQLYKTAGNFKPTAKILVSANNEPILTEFDEAVRRRFVCVPWSVTIPERERIAPLEMYVQSLLRDGGASGFLNWAIEGLHDLMLRSWRLEPPQAALDKTQTYISTADRVATFFRQWFEDGPGSNLNTKQLRKYYVAYIDEPSKFVMSPHNFTKECKRIFKDRCHQGHSNFYVVDDLVLSERGRTEYAARQQEMFAEQDS